MRRRRSFAGSVGLPTASTPRTTLPFVVCSGTRVLPLLERIHPAARANLLRSLEQRPTLPPALGGAPRRSARLAPRRSRRRDPGRTRAGSSLARARTDAASRRGELGWLADPFGAPRVGRPRLACRRPSRGAFAQDPGRVRRRKGAPLRARGVAARRAPRRSARGAWHRRGGGCRGVRAYERQT